MLMAVFLLVVGAGSLCLSGRVVLPGIRRGVLLGIRIDELTDLTHRESLHLFLGDGRVKLLQDQESLILPQRHTGSVRLADQLDVPGMAVDVLMGGGASLHLPQDAAALAAVLPGDGHRQNGVLLKVGADLLRGQQLLQRLAVVQILQLERIGDGLPLIVISLHRDDPIKAVDAQLQRRVEVDADEGGRNQEQPVAAQRQHKQQAHRRQCRTPMGAAPRLPPDKLLRKIGLSGRSFVPMLIGFGCTVPAVMATRALESVRDRRRTIAIIPFMSCSARLPIYVLFAEMFFPENALLAAYSLYLLGLAAGIAMAYIVHKTREDGGDGDALLIELPEYKTPNARTVAIYVWDKVKDYLLKAGTTIFTASVILWFVMNLGPSGFVSDVSESFGALIGRFIAPLLAPAGLGLWQVAVALISGLSAKEVVVSSFSVLYGITNINSPAGMGELSSQLAAVGFGPLNAYALMVFCLLYTPCMAAIATIKKETGSWRWTLGLALFQIGVAWAAAVIVFQVGRLIFG